MSEAFKYGDICTTSEIIKANFKKKPAKTVPPGSDVEVVSCSANMAIIRYRGDTFATRIENLTLKSSGVHG